MALKLILLAVTLTAVAAYDSKCPGWDYCSIYTREELAIIYYNSKYCMDLVPDKMVGNRFGYGQVRELCLGKGLDIVNFRGAPKEDEAEEISNCVSEYFGMAVVAPTYTCLAQALEKDISDMEKIPYSAAQKQVIMGMIDKCMEQVPDQTPREACRAVAKTKLDSDSEWKANLPTTVEYCLYEDQYNLPSDVKIDTTNCLKAALTKPLTN